MKKKLLLMMSVLLSLGMLCACSNDNSELVVGSVHFFQDIKAPYIPVSDEDTPEWLKPFIDDSRKGSVNMTVIRGRRNGQYVYNVHDDLMSSLIGYFYDQDGNRYMAFNMVKMRTKTNRTYIAQPFYQNSTIRLVEDLGGIPQFKESIHTLPQMNNGSSIVKISGASSMTNNITDVINDFVEEENENAFNKKKFYNLDEASSNRPVIECPIEFADLSKTTEAFNSIMMAFNHINNVEIPIQFMG